MEEYNPLQHIPLLLSYWWLALLTTFAGGLGGFVFSLAHVPVYEARAVYFINLDLTLIPNPLQPLEQHEEDLALGSTEAALLNQAVIQFVLDEASKQAVHITKASLLKDSIIERRGTFWDLRYHNSSPSTAQWVTNTWAARGYQAMLEMQKNGQVAPYILFNPPTLAEMPQSPVYYVRTRLILAGGLIGIIVGFLLANRFSSIVPNTRKTPEP